jgi:hypothetical protein
MIVSLNRTCLETCCSFCFRPLACVDFFQFECLVCDNGFSEYLWHVKKKKNSLQTELIISTLGFLNRFISSQISGPCFVALLLQGYHINRFYVELWTKLSNDKKYSAVCNLFFKFKGMANYFSSTRNCLNIKEWITFELFVFFFHQSACVKTQAFSNL